MWCERSSFRKSPVGGVVSALLATLFSSSTLADVVTYSSSSQTVILTGIGLDSSGRAQHKVQWGNCVFDGTNTNCTVSAPYKGLGPGGTLSIVFTYPGNGPAPLTSYSRTPGSNELYFNWPSNSSWAQTLTPASGSPISFYDPTFSFFFDPGATCAGVMGTCSVSAVGTVASATMMGTVNGQVDLTPVIRATQGAITASAYGAFSAIAQGTWMEIYGTNLGTVRNRIWGAADFSGAQAPTSLSGTKVTVAGLPAYVEYVDAGRYAAAGSQVNVQVPSGVPTGPQQVIVTTPGGTSLAYSIMVNPVEPGLLAIPAFQLPAGQYPVCLFDDGKTFMFPVPSAAVPTRAAKPGDTMVCFGIGFGPVTPNITAGLVVNQTNNLSGQVQFSFGSTQGQVAFAGLVSGFVGLYQVNVVVPNVAANSALPLSVTLNGTAVPQSLVVAVSN